MNLSEEIPIGRSSLFNQKSTTFSVVSDVGVIEMNKLKDFFYTFRYKLYSSEKKFVSH